MTCQRWTPNLLVSYLVAYDKKQFKSPKAFIEDATLTEPLFDPLSVSVELEWVLRSLYDVNKETMLTVFSRLLESREIEFQDESIIETTLSLYADHNADFTNCLHIASAHSSNRAPLITFDRKASQAPGVQLLE